MLYITDCTKYLLGLKAIHTRKIFGFNITPEAIVGHIIVFGARLVDRTLIFIKVLHLKK